MKALRFLTILFLTQAFCLAGDTAYQALRLAGAHNQELLNHVIQVQGTDGQPQPQTWHLLIDDQSARGGVREMEISKGRIVSEHTPVHAYVGAGANVVMDFKKLNLDSQGAFTIANQEAAKHNIGFNSVDYMLRGDEQGGPPVWVLKLIDVDNKLVGTITIAADSGTVLHADGMGNPRQDAVKDSTVPPDVAVTGTAAATGTSAAPAPVVT